MQTGSRKSQKSPKHSAGMTRVHSTPPRTCSRQSATLTGGGGTRCSAERRKQLCVRAEVWRHNHLIVMPVIAVLKTPPITDNDSLNRGKDNITWKSNYSGYIVIRCLPIQRTSNENIAWTLFLLFKYLLSIMLYRTNRLQSPFLICNNLPFTVFVPYPSA